MEIKEYKGYKYIVYDDKNIYFYGSLYMNYAYKNLEMAIKRNIGRLNNEYEYFKKSFADSDTTYYKSREYANGLIEKEVENYGK